APEARHAPVVLDQLLEAERVRLRPVRLAEDVFQVVRRILATPLAEHLEAALRQHEAPVQEADCVSPPVAAAREEGRVPRHLQQPADPRLAEILDIVVDAGEAELQPRYEVRCEADLEPR